jgi:hypothetical protein
VSILSALDRLRVVEVSMEMLAAEFCDSGVFNIYLLQARIAAWARAYGLVVELPDPGRRVLTFRDKYARFVRADTVSAMRENGASTGPGPGGWSREHGVR